MKGQNINPHELLFGRAAKILTNILPDNKNNESYPEYATALFKQIFDAQVSPRGNLEHSNIKSKEYYDRKANPQIFNDYVYLLKESLRMIIIT